MTKALGAIGAALLLVALWLAIDNPDIDGTSRGDDYTCLAPWDTVLNDADNQPGGEEPPDVDVIAARCREAGTDRFRVAVGALGTAVVVLCAAGAVSSRRRREDPAEAQSTLRRN